MRKNVILGGLVVLAVVVVAVVFLGRHITPAAGPADEVAFINGMQPIMAQVQNPAGADLADWRKKRAALICQTISNLTVTNWVGTVDKLDSSIAGGAIMSVAVMPDVDFGTATNVVSNLSSNTFIEPASTLFHTISTLQVGQKVRFSGQLFSSPTDCVAEASITESGSMQNPLFLTRFISVTALPQTGD
jgi:hypothetical protein